MQHKILQALALFAGAALAQDDASPFADMRESMDIQREALARLSSDFLGPSSPPPPTVQKRQSTITFAHPRARDFFVDGATLPDVPFDAGPSWSGLMPISGDPGETRKLFFWFWPASNVEHTDELLFWTNGGPGCSSLEGMFQENGPICAHRPLRGRVCGLTRRSVELGAGVPDAEPVLVDESCERALGRAARWRACRLTAALL